MYEAFNPYEPPHCRIASVDITRRVNFLGVLASFAIDTYEISVQWSGWTGAELYSVNGRERLRIRSFAPWGTRRFTIGNDDQRTIEIRFKYIPFWSTRVFLDGELVVEELFPGLRLLFRVLTTVVLLELVVALVLSIMFAIVWLYLR